MSTAKESRELIRVWLLAESSWLNEARLADGLERAFARGMAKAYGNCLMDLKSQLDAEAAIPPQKPVIVCPAGHGPMRYDIHTDRLHCCHVGCGAVATTHGNIIVDPDLVETKRP